MSKNLAKPERRKGQLGRPFAQMLEGRVLLSTTWTVTSTADDGTLGTLRYAINNSATNDTIQFSPALAAGNGSSIVLNGTALAVTHAMSIVGLGSDVLTILAGQQSSIFSVSANTSISGVTLLGGKATNGGIIDASSGSLTLSNMLISGGKATSLGGAIYAATSSLTMTNVKIQNSTAVQGGALYLASGTAMLTAVTFLTNSAASDTTPEGGALVTAAGTQATLSASTFAMNNTTGSNGASGPGGAIYNAGNLTIQNSTLGGNYTTGANLTSPGGAVFNGGTLTLTNDVIQGNHAIGRSGGGAVWCTGAANTTVSGSEFDDNYATDLSASGGSGGALSNSGTLSVINSTFNGNSSGVGGALFTYGTLSVINSTFANNSAPQGGALYLQPIGANVSMTNCTVVENSAANLCGGIGFFGTGTITFNNNIVAANHSVSASNEDDIQSTTAYGSHNLIGTSETGTATTGPYVNGVNGNIVGVNNPQLASLSFVNGSATQVMVPLAGSPVINAGSNALALNATGQPLTTDQIARARIINGTVDIGAVEYLGIPALATITGTAGADQISLTQDADHTHIDWTLNGTSSGQLTINDSTGLIVNGDGNTDNITLDYTNGNPLPNKLILNGTFTLKNLATTGNPLAGTTLDIKTSTLFIIYPGPTSDPLPLIQGYLKNGYNSGAWTGTATASTGAIQSSSAAASSLKFSAGYADSADVANPAALPANTIKLRYTAIGDVNLDGTVGLTDLTTLLQNYNIGTKWDQGELTYDDTVSLTDLTTLLQLYNSTAASPVAIPAPAAPSTAAVHTPPTSTAASVEATAAISATLASANVAKPQDIEFSKGRKKIL